MKKLSLTLCALTAFALAASAGTESYSSKETQSAPASCPTWFADSEFNVTLSGVYAATTNEYLDDRYLGVDHAWGGAIDAKYFFRRYFGVGLQGFGLATEDNRFNRFRNNRNDFTGGALGTFTFRYPIPCTRFAPYGWAGVGAVFNGNDNFNVNNNNDDARLMGQYGGGFEVRFTPHLGWTNDVSYNQINRGNNDFIQVRTGLNFAF
ncbi:MAG: outer membrane beta-barrel protein [Chthoniobacterales bacterium]